MRFIFLCLIISMSAHAEDHSLLSGTSTYTVKHLIKRVQGESGELKGKVSCPGAECEFLIATPVKSFTSSDSNRDENMRVTLESIKYPLTIATGRIPRETFLKMGKSRIPVMIEFHGIKNTYEAVIERNSKSEMMADVILKLTSHNVVRPSLFGVSIDDEVPVHFKLKWSEGI